LNRHGVRRGPRTRSRLHGPPVKGAVLPATLVALPILLLGCKEPEPAVTAGTDSGWTETGSTSTTPPEVSAYAFTEASLDPPFQHVNSVWAGVALLDYDDDGWLDIFLTQGGSHVDALYRNGGDGTFTDVAASVGLDQTTESGAAVAGDLDNDGDTDLVVSVACSTGSWHENGDPLLDGAKIVYLNEGGQFTRIDQELPPEEDVNTEVEPSRMLRCSVSMGLGDMDGDGYLDLIVSNAHDPDAAPPWAFDKYHPGGQNVIFYNDGAGAFTRSSQDFGTWGSFVSLQRDFDLDGRMDVIFGQSGRELTAWRQTQDGSFEMLDGFIDSGKGIWMGLAQADYDRDLELDIYATNQGLSPLIQGYDNLLEWYPGEVEVELDWSDLDGEPEVINAWVNPHHSLIDGASLSVDHDWGLQADHLLAGDLFEGIGDRYTELVGPKGLGRLAWGWGAVPLDVDADGWMDVAYVGNSCSAPMTIIWTEEAGAGPGGLLINDRQGGFVDETWNAGVANTDADGLYQDGRGVATGDLNNDGYPDLVVASRTYNPSQTDPLAQEMGVPRVFLSQPRDGRWLQIDLVGTSSNRDGLGSTITLTAGDQTWVTTLGVGGSTNSWSENLVTMGLGDATTVDVTVEFPSGVSVQETDVATNQRIIIEEGS